MSEERSLLGSFAIFGFLNIFLLGLIVSSTVFWRTEDRQYETFYKLPSFCLPCADLALHPDDPPGGIIRQNNDTECCANSTDTLSVLVDQYTRNWSKEYLYEKSPEYHGCRTVPKDERFGNLYRNNPTKEYFKILGYENRKLPATKHRTVHWDEDSVLSSSGMVYQHGHVNISVEGLYQIYSQVVIDYRERWTNYTGTPNMFLHAMSLIKDMQESHVISSTLSQCKSDPNNAYTTSHLGAVYHFHKGDLVLVKLSYPEDIVPSRNMNFFGVHMI